MKRLGCLIALVGIMLVAGSLFLFGAAILGLTRPQPEDLVYPLADESLEPIVVSGLTPGGHRRLACRLEIETGAVQEVGHGNGVFEPRFRFPIAFIVRGSGGRILVQGDAPLAWDARDRRTLTSQAAAAHASLVSEQIFAACTVPADGALSVTLLIRGDDTFHATHAHAWLVLHDAEVRSGPLALGGALLLVVGPMCVATGLGMVVIGLVRRKKKRTAKPIPEPEPPVPPT